MNTSKLIAIFLAVFAITSHAATYVITGSGTTFTATENGTTVGTAGQPIQTVIDAIKSDANGAASTIQFGDGTTVLDIGTATITFNGSGTPTWGLITLEGKLTSASTSTSGIIIINNGASVTSNAELTATSSGYLLYHNSIGMLTISGGTVSATTGRAVYNRSGGAVTISGGTVSATANGTAVRNNSTGTVIVNGGTVTGGTKYYNNNSNGTIIAWDNPSGSKIYTAFATNDITKYPATATAVWFNKDGKAGIDYANGSNAVGFIELGVTVNKVKITKPTVTNTSLTYNSTEQSAGIAINAAYTVTGDKGTNAGNYTATVALKDKANYEWTDDGSQTDLSLTWSIEKASGLENDAPPVRDISATNTNQHEYDLTLLALNKADHGALSYELGEFTGNTNILAAKPEFSNSEHTIITFTGTGKTEGTATLEIIVTSDNYTDITAILTFNATAKEEVEITGVTHVATYIYDGTPKSGYTSTPIGTIIPSKTNETSTPYTGEFLYEWAGTNDPQGTTQPTDVGEYTVKISLKNDAYTGVWSKKFFITPKPITKPAAPTNLVYNTTEQIALTSTADYTVTGETKGTAAGSYTATVALTDNNRVWADGTNADLSLAWAIAKATVATPASLTATVGQTLASVTLPAGWEWATPTASVGTAGTQTHKATYTPTDVANYNALTDIDVTITVAAAADPNPIRQQQLASRTLKVQTIGNYIVLENLPQNAKVEVYNLQGKLMHSSHSVNSQILRIPVQTKGMYIVKIK